MLDIIIDYMLLFLREMWVLCLEMAPYLLLGMLVSGLISIFIDSSFIFKHIGQKNAGSVLKSTLFGIPLPLCSCGVIPVAATLRESGASKGATVSFLVSTPQTGVDSIFLTYGMLGPVFALFRPLAALASGFFSGIVINNFDHDMHHHLSESDNAPKTKESLDKRIISGVKYGFLTLPADIVIPLTQGLVVAAAIAILIPPQFIAEHFSSSNLIQYTMMLAVSLPIYVCATASIPIAVVLMAKGITPGAAFIFLMAGPATNASSIAVIKNILGKRTLYHYLVLIAFTAISFGYILDNFLTITLPDMSSHTHHHVMDDFGSIILSVIFLVILVNAYFYRSKSESTDSKDIENNIENDQEKIAITVDGMTCSHCKESVESAIYSFSGVASASVDLLTGNVIVVGSGLDETALKEKITAKGFSTK
tara:strand:+ start:1148 stop:2413 length:1266 start_codon:yes stop_codon:yes gene_type:complete